MTNRSRAHRSRVHRPRAHRWPALNLIKVLHVLEVLNLLITTNDPSLACWALFLFSLSKKKCLVGGQS